MPPNAWDKSFLSWTPAGIDKPGMHLDSPIKMGKWSDIEALYRAVAPLYPLAYCAPWAPPEYDFLAYGTRWGGTGVAGKAKKRVARRSCFRVKYAIWEALMFVRSNTEPEWHCIIYTVSSCMPNSCTVLLPRSCTGCSSTKMISSGWKGI